MLSFDELCNGNDESGTVETTESALPLPPIDILQPLTIGLEQPSAESVLTPTTSSSASAGVATASGPATAPSESSYDEVEQILRAIKGEFNEQDIIVIDGDNTDNDVINVYSSNEECEQDGKLNVSNGITRENIFNFFSNSISINFAEKDENDEDDDDDEDDEADEDDADEENDDEEGGDELRQEAKRQRLNQSPPSGEQDAPQSAESSAVVWMTAQPPSWHPRRRLVRGRRVLRGNRGSSNQVPNIDAVDDDETGEPQAAGNSSSSGPSSNNEIAENATNAVTPSPATVANNAAGANATPSTAAGEASQIPDGIDPSFLAALPEEMRDEVIAEHLRYVNILNNYTRR